MKLKVFDHDDVERLLPMAECIDVVEEALRALDRGEYSMPLRTVFTPPGATGGMAWMPAYRSGEQPVYGMKTLVVVPGNPARGLDSHQGAVILLDGVTGELRAIMDASAVTAIRTAAASAVATRLLARPDSRVHGIIGVGVQARKHFESILLAAPIRDVIVAGRSRARAEEFVNSLSVPAGVRVEAAAGIEELMAKSDVVSRCTNSAEPILRAQWLRPGMHINAVGASRPPNFELEPSLLARVALFTDRRESLDGEATEWRLAREQRLVTPDHFRGELGQVLNGSRPGRASLDEVTLFRSLGLAIEDLAAAQRVLANAG